MNLCQLSLYWILFIIGFIALIIFVIITTPKKVTESFSLFKKIGKAFKSAGKTVASGVTSASKTVASGVTSTAKTVASGVVSAEKATEKGVTQAANVVEDTAKLAATEAQKAGESALEEAKKLAELLNIERVFKEVIGELEKFFNMIESIPKDLKNVGDSIKGVANGAIKGVADTSTTVGKEMDNLGVSIANELKNVDNVFRSIPDTFEKKLKFPIS